MFSKDLYDVVGEKGDVVGLAFLIRELLVIASTPNLAYYYQFLDIFNPQGLRKEAFARLKKIDKIWEPIVDEKKREQKMKMREECKGMLDILLANNYNDVEINNIFLSDIPIVINFSVSLIISWTYTGDIWSWLWKQKHDDGVSDVGAYKKLTGTSQTTP
ncbi:hypothetical protein Syun_012830 [Stephania yunnanensis]|uniref:Uncharacterized protein n=1 Tax=Stephania yunnanensis TaxID=152371 RepID=A0AAP0K2D2_9MAGN